MASHRRTDRSRERALEGFRQHGSGRGAAKHAGIPESTLRLWRRDDPEFNAAALDAIDEALQADGEAASSYVREHIEALRTGQRVARQVLHQPSGRVVEVLEPLKPEAGLIQAALRKWNAGYRASLPAPAVEPSDGGTLIERLRRVEELQASGRLRVVLDGEVVGENAAAEPALPGPELLPAAESA